MIKYKQSLQGIIFKSCGTRLPAYPIYNNMNIPNTHSFSSFTSPTAKRKMLKRKSSTRNKENFFRRTKLVFISNIVSNSVLSHFFLVSPAGKYLYAIIFIRIQYNTYRQVSYYKVVSACVIFSVLKIVCVESYLCTLLYTVPISKTKNQRTKRNLQEYLCEAQYSQPNFVLFARESWVNFVLQRLKIWGLI